MLTSITYNQFGYHMLAMPMYLCCIVIQKVMFSSVIMISNIDENKALSSIHLVNNFCASYCNRCRHSLLNTKVRSETNRRKHLDSKQTDKNTYSKHWQWSLLETRLPLLFVANAFGMPFQTYWKKRKITTSLLSNSGSRQMQGIVSQLIAFVLKG